MSALAILGMTAPASAGPSITFKGYVKGYGTTIGGEIGKQGHRVTVEVQYAREEWSSTYGGYVCGWGTRSTHTLSAASNGWYSKSINTYHDQNLDCLASAETNWTSTPATRVVVTVDDVLSAEHTTGVYYHTWSNHPYYGTEALPSNIRHDFKRFFPVVDDTRELAARRFGTGAYPLYVVHGFDTGEAFRTECSACPGGTCGTTRTETYNSESDFTCGGWGEMLAASYLDAAQTKSFYQFARENDYTIWVVRARGWTSGASIKGTLSNGSNGLAYRMMSFVKDIHDANHAGKPMILGGYSMGGLLVKVGLSRWCDGTWDTSALGYKLERDCPDVSLWWAGDAPISYAAGEGAHVPVSLQRYAQDANAGAAFGGAPALRTAAAKEMLAEWIDAGSFGNTCNTNCDDALGCSSFAASSFKSGCSENSGPRDAFRTWADNTGIAGRPRRISTGVAVPSVAFGVGKAAGSASCASGPFWKSDVSCWGDHELYPNSAGGQKECDNGSLASTLQDFDNYVVYGVPYCGNNATVTVGINYLPGFIPTSTSLEWPNRNAWKDYWYNSVNAPHTGPLPRGAATMLMAWASEYAKGRKDKPVCGDPYKQVGKKSSSNCRSASVEVINGADDDGDELIDESHCGNGSCESGETTTNCAADCPAPAVCGNGICQPGESCETSGGSGQCQADCGCCAGWTPVCFPAGAPIAMADGSTKPIEAIAVGDRVLAFDETLRLAVPSFVTRVYVHSDQRKPLVRINGDLVATANHPFYVDGSYARADALELGALLTAAPEQDTEHAASMATTIQTVDSLETLEGVDVVYNFEVAGYHNYFAGGVLVHNKTSNGGCEYSGGGGTPEF